jgi:DNA-binding MarR family transcriptional regulator
VAVFGVTNQAELCSKPFSYPFQMNHRDIRLLQLLEAVGNEKPTSQRALARQLDVSLGLVNGFLQKLTGDGFCCISTSSSKQKKYALTTEGKAERSRLAYDYILLSYRLFKEAQGKLVSFFKTLESGKLNRVVFYGINDFAEMAYLSLQETSIEIVAVVDNERVGDYFFGLKVEDPNVLMNYTFDKILITENSSYARKLAKKLDRDGLKGKVSVLTT